MLNKGALRNRILLVIGIVILANLFANRFFHRFDFTADKRYTLSTPTKAILKELKEPLTVKAFFSEGLSPSIDENRQNFLETLEEYASVSGGMLRYEFVNPIGGEETEQQALEAGIRPFPQPFREGDRMVTKNVFSGAEFLYGDQKETLPVIPPGTSIEYELSSTIKKISVFDKPSIGLVQGHGEASASALQQVNQALSVLYNVIPANLADTALITKFEALAIVAPKDSFQRGELNALDAFLATGKGICIAMNRVNADLSTGYGQGLTTGLEFWLSNKGILVREAFVTDINCGNVAVQQRQGFFSVQRQLPMPFLPTVSNFADHPVSKGLESVTFPFVSSVAFQGDSTLSFTPLAFTSSQSNEEAPPILIDINREWTDNDFTRSRIGVAAAMEGNLSGSGAIAKLVVIGDGDFAVNGEGREARTQPEDNINLLVNAIDWLADDSGLNELRTKAITSRPIDKELTDGQKTAIKFGNFLIPILLIIGYGIVRYQLRRRQKSKWLATDYGK